MSAVCNCRLAAANLTVAFLCTVASAQITGIVVDSSTGEALDSTAACLSLLAECDTTDASGTFSVGTQVAVPTARPATPAPSIGLHDGMLVLRAHGPVAVSVFTASGRRAFHRAFDNPRSLSTRVDLRQQTRNRSEGLMVIRVTTPEGGRVFRAVSLSGFSCSLPGGEPVHSPAAKQQGPAVDTLSLVRAGYVTQRIPVDSYTLDLDTVRIVSVPAPVQLQLTATLMSCQAISLTWQASGDGITGFALDRDAGQSGIFAVLGQSGAAATSYSDLTALPYQSYRYRLHALDSQGDTLASDTASASTGACGSWHDAVAYHIVVDRFSNGDVSNDATPIPGVPSAADYSGGDFRGITNLISDNYFDGLGVNTLIITFPAENADGGWPRSDGEDYACFDGTAPVSLDQVESRFGGESALSELIDAAHERGMRIVCQYTLRQLHQDASLVADSAAWFHEQCICGDGCSWLPPEGYRCWHLPWLPSFDFTNASALAYTVSKACSWIRSRGFDGLLIEASDQTDPVVFEALRAVLTDSAAQFGDAGLFGVRMSTVPENIRPYANPDSLFDGLIDDILRVQVAQSILGQTAPMSDLATFVATNDTFYHDDALMLHALGTHYSVRAVHLAEAPPLFAPIGDGDDRVWTNQPVRPSDPTVFKRLELAYTLLFTIGGIPSVYYGDEIAMPGAAFPDNSRMMQLTGLDSYQIELLQHVQSLGQIRAAYSALRYGALTTLESTDNAWVYAMADSSDTVYVALNRSDAPATLTGLPTGTFGEQLTGAVVSEITLQPWSSGVYVRQ